MLVRALEAKDRYTAGHAERVANYARLIGEELRFTPARLERLRFAALMHDIGKLVVPNHLLNKPGKLTAEEFARVRMHEAVSAEMLSHIDFLAPVAQSSLSEHTVYQPDDAKHPIEPYIVMVADAYDAMTSTRSYRQALPPDVAIAELRDKAGSQFHPECADALIRALERDGHEARPAETRTSTTTGRSRPPRSAWARPVSATCSPTPAPTKTTPNNRPARRYERSVADEAASSASRGSWSAASSRPRPCTSPNPTRPPAGAVLLAAGAVLGELLVLRLDDGTGLPLSYAVLIVLVTCSRPPAAVALVVVGAELVAVVVRVEPRRFVAARGDRRPAGPGRGGRARHVSRRPAGLRKSRASRRGARRARGHRGRGVGRRRAAADRRPPAQRAGRSRQRRVDRAGFVRGAHGRRIRRSQRPRRSRRLGSAAVLDPAARNLVLVRAARLDQPHLPADDRGAGDGARARWRRAAWATRSGSPRSPPASGASSTSTTRTSTTSRPRRCCTTSGR